MQKHARVRVLEDCEGHDETENLELQAGQKGYALYFILDDVEVQFDHLFWKDLVCVDKKYLKLIV